MPVYGYRALDEQSKRQSGVITGDTPRAARQLLRERGLRVQEIWEETAKRSGSRRFVFRSYANSSFVVAFLSELSTLLSVGVPITEAFNTLQEQNKGHFKATLLRVREAILSGASLAESLAAEGAYFDELAIRMIEVGENAGNLDVVLRRLAQFKLTSAQFRDRVFSALFYPGIVLSVAICVSIFLMTYVVPMLLTNLLESGKSLPWPTLVLKTVSDILVGYGLWLLAAAVLGLVGSVSFLNTKLGTRCWYLIMRKLPLIGDMAFKQELARVSMVMATMLESGIVFLQALETASRTTKNVLMREAFQVCKQEVLQGRELGEAMRKAKYFPPLVVHVYSLGQQSGQLETMLLRLAENYDHQVATMSGRLAAAIEPVLIVVLAIIVGFILFATMLPILEAGNVL